MGQPGAGVSVEPVGDLVTGWGESVRWDDRRGCWWFTDCASWTLYRLEADADAPDGFKLPSMLAGLVLTEGDELVGCLDDGLHVIDVDRGTSALLSPYPSELGGRANDAHADLDGNLVTGTLNLEPAAGSTWWYSSADGWRLLDDEIANTNGPNAIELDGASTLIVGDTSAVYYSYPYDGRAGTVGARSVFADTGAISDGLPDGSTVDEDDGLWVAAFGGGVVARFTPAGHDRTVRLPVNNPTDLAFGGADRTSLLITTTAGEGDLDGRLLRVEGLGHRGRAEPRFAL